MAITIALVFAGKNRLRYLCTVASSGNDTGTITSTGAATPDLQTDAAGGVIEQLAKVVANGYGPLAAGAQTQAKARALWLSDRAAVAGLQPITGWSFSGTGVTAGPPTARCLLTRRTGTHLWLVDADVSAGDPILSLASRGDGVVANGTAYLDIEVPGALGA